MSTCPICGGTGWIDAYYPGNEMERQPPEQYQENCWLCNAKPETYADLADQYDQLRAAGYSNDVAAQYVDMML